MSGGSAPGAESGFGGTWMMSSPKPAMKVFCTWCHGCRGSYVSRIWGRNKDMVRIPKPKGGSIKYIMLFLFGLKEVQLLGTHLQSDTEAMPASLLVRAPAEHRRIPLQQRSSQLLRHPVLDLRGTCAFGCSTVIPVIPPKVKSAKNFRLPDSSVSPSPRSAAIGSVERT